MPRAEGATGVESQLSQHVGEIVRHVREEEERLAAERQGIQEEREAMTAAHKVKMEELEKQRAAFEKEKKEVAAANETLKSKVKLDVGGTINASSRTTLTSVPGSMLEAMFSGRHNLEEDEDGRIFIVAAARPSS